MNSVRKLIKADNALMRSGPVGITQKLLYALYIMLLLYPIFATFDGYNGGVLYFDMYMGAFYSTAMFLYSGYFPMVDNRTMNKGFCYTFIRSAYFMPFTKADYIKAGFIQWVKIYAPYLVAQIITMIIAIVKAPHVAEAMGAVYFLLGIYHIIMGITLFIPIVFGQKKLVGNFWWYLNGGIAIAVMIGFLFIEEFFAEKAAELLGWYCSVWGIIGGIAVVPIVGVIITLMFRNRKSTTWFRG